MTIKNTGIADDRLTKIVVADAEKAEIHETKVEGGIMRMRALPGPLLVKPGTVVTFAPEGMHLMIFSLSESRRAGDKLPFVMHFQSGQSVAVAAEVKPSTFKEQR